MYVTIDNTVQVLYTLTREPKISSYFSDTYISLHTLVLVYDQSPWTLESDL